MGGSQVQGLLGNGDDTGVTLACAIALGWGSWDLRHSVGRAGLYETRYFPGN